MAEYKERDAFPEVPDYKINIGDNLDGGPLSVSDIYSPKSEPVLIDNALDPSEKLLKEIVVLIDDFGKKSLKKSISKEIRSGTGIGPTDGTNASVLKNGSGVCPKGHSHKDQEDFALCEKGGVDKAFPLAALAAGSLLGSDDGEPEPAPKSRKSRPSPEAAVIKSISKFLKG